MVGSGQLPFVLDSERGIYSERNHVIVSRELGDSWWAVRAPLHNEMLYTQVCHSKYLLVSE